MRHEGKGSYLVGRPAKITSVSVAAIAENVGLGALLSDLRVTFGGYELLDHWQRGEFHHDLLLRVVPNGRLKGS